MRTVLFILFINTLLLSYDVTSMIKVLNSPYKDIYPNKKELYARNIWDMKEFEAKLYMGAGNSSNIGPAQNAGPLPLISYDPSTKKFERVSVIHDEQIDIIKTFRNRLYIPGHDATQSWDYANIYIKEAGKELKKYRNIKDGLHVYDLAFYKDKIFAALGTKRGAAVAISSDNAKSWDIRYLGRYRIYSFLEVDDRLFAIKFFPSSKYLQKMPAKTKDLFFSVAEYKKGKFEPIRDLTSKDFFPDTNNIEIASQKIIRPVKTSKGSIYIGAFLHNDHQSLPFGTYYVQILKNRPICKKVTIPNNYDVWDIIKKNNDIYLLSYNRMRKAVAVLHAKEDDLDSFKEYISFKSSSFARSFEYMEGIFYFSIGSEVKDPKKFDYNEIDKDTGKIAIFDTRYITN